MRVRAHWRKTKWGDHGLKGLRLGGAERTGRLERRRNFSAETLIAIVQNTNELTAEKENREQKRRNLFQISSDLKRFCFETSLMDFVEDSRC
jgi:hypothetical protein